MGSEIIHIDLSVKGLEDLEEISLLTGRNLSEALAASLRETLLRERLEYGIFRSTMMDYGGLIPDGSIRIRPCVEESKW